MNVAVASSVGTISRSDKVSTCADTEVCILRGILDAEVTVSCEVRVLSLNAGQVVRLEVLGTLLFKPGTHVGGA